mmetsp:Transcript_22051/g.61458  ORF Transcript_22051/g.61458 Transcript_22051/m.61458 type:complete len:243 (-) Transcript_22051:30-758(-)
MTPHVGAIVDVGGEGAVAAAAVGGSGDLGAGVSMRLISCCASCIRLALSWTSGVRPKPPERQHVGDAPEEEAVPRLSCAANKIGPIGSRPAVGGENAGRTTPATTGEALPAAALGAAEAAKVREDVHKEAVPRLSCAANRIGPMGSEPQAATAAAAPGPRVGVENPYATAAGPVFLAAPGRAGRGGASARGGVATPGAAASGGVATPPVICCSSIWASCLLRCRKWPEAVSARSSEVAAGYP